MVNTNVNQSTDKTAIERIYAQWDQALSNNDTEALLALYAADATIESPLVIHSTGKSSGILKGREQFRFLFQYIAAHVTENHEFYRNGYLTDGRKIMFEYLREAPNGEKMDLVEVMEINDDGLIEKHRVYWGWHIMKILQGAV